MDDATAIRHHGRMSKFRVECAALAFAVLSNGVAATPADVAAFARAPRFAHAALSPDGARVSYVDEVDGRQSVFLRRVDGERADATLRVQPPTERIRWCDWADSRYLLCGSVLTVRKQHAVVERTKLYAIDSQDLEVRTINARHDEGAADQVIDLMPQLPERVLLQIDFEGRGFPEVVELNVASGKSRPIVRSHPPIRSWMSNGRGSVRLGLSYEDHTARVFARRSDSDTWREVMEQSLTDPEAIGPLAFGATDTELFALKHHAGRAALVRVDLFGSAAPTVLFADPMFDVSGPIVLDPKSRALLAVRYQRETPAVQFFADSERLLQAWLDRELPGVANEVVARALDGSRLLVRSGSDVDPPSLYLADVKARRLRLFGHSYPQLESVPLTAMKPMMYAARDGQRIPGYLTRPAAHPSPGPAIVLPHGGPEARDVRQFDPLVQFLAARGYAVLQMNYRGSMGYGAGFAAAGAQQWGGVIHNDITDAAHWLVGNEIADPERLCIVGSSFGGYAALLGAARESEWYACAVSFGGTSDLLAFAEYTRRMPDAAMWRERLGEDTRALWQMSPLALAWRIETPVMLVHGRRDAVVPISQSRRLARSLRSASKPHRLVERTDCDHWMTAQSCRMAFFTALDEFLHVSLAPE